MNSTRLWTFGSIIVVIALVAGTWFIGISPRLSEASAANDMRATVEAQNSLHEVTLGSLEKQFENIRGLRGDLEKLRTAVPADSGIPDLITQINSMAAAAGVSVSSITFLDPSRYVPIENTTEDPELAAAFGSVTPETFFVIPLDIAVTGTYQGVMAFVASIQAGERLILVHDLVLSSGAMAADTTVEFTISGQVFVLATEGAEPPIVPQAPIAGAAPADDGEAPQ